MSCHSTDVEDSVSEELLCAFELLKPLDGPALRKEMTKAKRKRYVNARALLGFKLMTTKQHDGCYMRSLQ